MPEERQVTDFYFRQLRKIQVGDPGIRPDSGYSLLCISNKFGLTFVGCNNGVYLFPTAILHSVDSNVNLGPKNVMADFSCLKAAHVPTPGPPQHVALSSDSLTLSVVVNEGGFLKCCFYDIRALIGKVQPVIPFCSITLATDPAVQLCGLSWNPSPDFPNLVAVIVSSGKLQLLDVKDDVKVVDSKPGVAANAICWSPKGKQFAVGLKDGTICQILPKGFEVKRMIPCPNIFNNEPQQVSDLHWISSFIFAVMYTPLSPTETMPSHVFLQIPKETPLSITNFDDVFYGTGTKAQKFYFVHISTWNILIASSANATESAIFGPAVGGGEGWDKWELEDTGRVEMPLDDSSEETYVAGSALALTSQVEVVISEEKKLPPSPLLILYSDHGVLCPFTVVNMGCSPAAIAQLMVPPEPFPAGPPRKPVSQPETQAPIGIAKPQAIPSSQADLQRLQGTQSKFPGAGDSFSVAQQLRGSQANTSGAAAFGKPPLLGGPLLVTPATSGGGLFSLSSLPTTGGIGEPGPFSGLSGLGGGQKLGTASASKPSFSFNVSSLASEKQGDPSTHKFGITQPPTLGQGLPTSVGFPPGSTTGPQAHFPPLGASRLFAPQPQVTVTLTQGTPAVTTTTALASQAGLGRLQIAGPPNLQATTLPGIRSQPTGQTQLKQDTPLSRPPPAYPSTPAPSSVTPGLPVLLTAESTGGGSHVTPPPNVLISQRSLQQQPPYMPVLSATLQSSSAAPSQLGGGQPSTLASRLPPVYTSPPQSGITAGPRLEAFAGAPPPLRVGTSQPSYTRPPPTYTSTPRVPGAHVHPSGLGPPQTEAHQQPPVSLPSTLRQPPQITSAPRVDTIKANSNSEVITTENIDASFSGHITDQKDSFVEELEMLKDELNEVFGEWEGVALDEAQVPDLGSMEDMQELCEMTQLLDHEVSDVMQQVKALVQKSEDLEDRTLKGFELADEARTKMEKKDDSNYSTLLRLRPLDVHSQRKLEEMRASYLHVQQNVSEVDSQLDADLEQKYEEKRQKGRTPMKAPSVQTIYSTLRNHRKITKMQSDNIERLANRMKGLRLIPRSWNPADAVSLQSPPLHIPDEDSAGTPTLEFSHESNDAGEMHKLAPEKARQLREYVGGITHTPVVKPRRTWYEPRRHYKLLTPQELGQSRSETPSSNAEGSLSVPESDLASTTEVLPPLAQHHRTMPPSFPDHTFSPSLIDHTFPTVPARVEESTPPSMILRASQDPRLLSYTGSTTSLASYHVTASPEGEIRRNTPQGYVPVTTLQHGAQGESPSTNRTHTVSWGAPQQTSDSETPLVPPESHRVTPATMPPGQQSGDVLGDITSGLLKRTDPVPDIARIQHLPGRTATSNTVPFRSSHSAPGGVTTTGEHSSQTPPPTSMSQPSHFSGSSIITQSPAYLLSNTPTRSPSQGTGLTAGSPFSFASPDVAIRPPGKDQPRSQISSFLTAPPSPIHTTSAPMVAPSSGIKPSSASAVPTTSSIATTGSSMFSHVSSSQLQMSFIPSTSTGGTAPFQFGFQASKPTATSGTTATPFTFNLGGTFPFSVPSLGKGATVSTTEASGPKATSAAPPIFPFSVPSLGKEAAVGTTAASDPKATPAVPPISNSGFVFGPSSSLKLGSEALTSSQLPKFDPSKLLFGSKGESKDHTEDTAPDQSTRDMKPASLFTKPGSGIAPVFGSGTLHMPSALLSQSSKDAEEGEAEEKTEEAESKEEADVPSGEGPGLADSASARSDYSHSTVAGEEGEVEGNIVEKEDSEDGGNLPVEEEAGPTDNVPVTSQLPPHTTSPDINTPTSVGATVVSTNDAVADTAKPPAEVSTATVVATTVQDSEQPFTAGSDQPSPDMVFITQSVQPIADLTTPTESEQQIPPPATPTQTEQVPAPAPPTRQVPVPAPPMGQVPAAPPTRQVPVPAPPTGQVPVPAPPTGQVSAPATPMKGNQEADVEASTSTTATTSATQQMPIASSAGEEKTSMAMPSTAKPVINVPVSQPTEGQTTEAWEESEMEEMENDVETIEVNSQPDSSSVLGGGLFSGLGGLGAKGPTIATANPFGTPLSNVGPATTTPLRSGLFVLPSSAAGSGVLRPATSTFGTALSGQIPRPQMSTTPSAGGLAGPQFGGTATLGGPSAGSLFGGRPSLGTSMGYGEATPFSTSGLFGAQGSVASGNLFQQSSGEDMSFGSLAQSGSTGFGGVGGQGRETFGSFPSSGGTGSFGSWR